MCVGEDERIHGHMSIIYKINIFLRFRYPVEPSRPISGIYLVNMLRNEVLQRET